MLGERPERSPVKIEVSAERSLLLPFDQFAFAEITSDSKEQRLRLVFATHEVTMRGHSLRRIETAIQRMELSWLATLHAGQWEFVPEGQPIIRNVVVAEINGWPE